MIAKAREPTIIAGAIAIPIKYRVNLLLNVPTFFFLAFKIKGIINFKKIYNKNTINKIERNINISSKYDSNPIFNL
tara:strand:- start:1251 stop:1478 length:228 start_codon:yes stop_codon:yes gene_type:complete